MSLPQKVFLQNPISLKMREEKIYPVNTEKKWSVVSFFAGCGGFDLGFLGGFEYKNISYERLPFYILNSYEFNKKAIETYKKNIGDHITFQDLYHFNPEDMPTADVLIGGFPCQDFSIAGKQRGLHTNRGNLYKAMIRYAEFHAPKIIVGENVMGLLMLNNGIVLKQIINDIKEIGYKVKFWMIYGPDYGIPQTRKRIFIVCIREDLNSFPTFPKPTHVWDHKTIKWAIGDLEDIHSDDIIPNQSQFSKLKPSPKYKMRNIINNAEKPGYTVCAAGDSTYHYNLKRKLTIRECARIQTFPDSFVFLHNYYQNLAQIGNAVPPIMGHVIAQSISDFLKKENETNGLG